MVTKNTLKLLIYKFINKHGYNVYKKNTNKLLKEDALKKYNVKIHFQLLYNSYKYIQLFEDKFSDLSITEEEKGLKFSFSNLTFLVDSGEEFIILKEIYIDHEYNFEIGEECVVIDVGANVGMASIFFAQKEKVKKIYAFEPVKDNYEIAINNFKFNNISKIQLANYGLGSKTREEVFLFCKELKGNSGIRWKNNLNYSGRENVEERVVNIKKASSILESIIKAETESRLIMKIDCEGAEYEILQDLHEENLLVRISVLMIEWHDRGAEILIDQLERNNFIVFSRSLGPISGMIYAVNKIL